MTQVAYDADFYAGNLPGSLASARVVLPILFESYRPKSVVDVGCGTGTWLRAAKDQGVRDVLGLDGEWVKRNSLMIDDREFKTVDLLEDIRLDKRYDLAMSMEVAEHLPPERADGFVADLCRMGDVVLFSAAIPNQGGTEHINEQWPEYWALLFRRFQYLPFDIIRRRIWAVPEVEWWYVQNTLVFAYAQDARWLLPEARPSRGPLSLIHPRSTHRNASEHSAYTELLREYLNCTGTEQLKRKP